MTLFNHLGARFQLLKKRKKGHRANSWLSRYRLGYYCSCRANMTAVITCVLVILLQIIDKRKQKDLDLFTQEITIMRLLKGNSQGSLSHNIRALSLQFSRQYSSQFKIVSFFWRIILDKLLGLHAIAFDVFRHLILFLTMFCMSIQWLT
jgi:hypothetical protein